MTAPMLTLTIGDEAWLVDLTDDATLGLIAAVQFLSLAQQGVEADLTELLATIPADAEIRFEFTEGTPEAPDLDELADLRDAGVLTDAQYAAASGA